MAAEKVGRRRLSAPREEAAGEAERVATEEAAATEAAAEKVAAEAAGAPLRRGGGRGGRAEKARRGG